MLDDRYYYNNMADVHKAHKKKTEKKEKPVETKSEETKTEPVVVSDVVTEPTERIEVVEEISPDAPKSDTLADFKEKMSEEKSLSSDIPPKKNFLWSILFVVVIVLLVLGGIFIYKQFKNSEKDKVNVVTLSVTPTEIPTPQPTVDLTKYSIKILNGSGIDGEASRQKTNLENSGFKISSIGNAANSNYTDTIIQAKKDTDKTFLDKLKKVLQNSYSLGEVTELPDSSASSVVVIIGSKKNQ